MGNIWDAATNLRIDCWPASPGLAPSSESRNPMARNSATEAAEDDDATYHYLQSRPTQHTYRLHLHEQYVLVRDKAAAQVVIPFQTNPFHWRH